MDQFKFVDPTESKTKTSNDDRLKCGEIYYENFKIYFECFFCELVIENQFDQCIQHLINHLPIDCENKQQKSFENENRNKNFIPESEYKTENTEDIEEDLNLDEEKFYVNNLETGLIKEIADVQNIQSGIHNSTFCCPLTDCQYSNRAIYEVLQHMFFNHNMIVRKGSQYLCSICRNEYNRSNHVDRHLKSQHGYFTGLTDDLQNSNELMCPQCNVTCSQYHHLNTHLKKHHPDYFRSTLLQKQEKYYNENKNYLKYFTQMETIGESELTETKLFSKVDDIWHCNYCEVKQILYEDMLSHVESCHINQAVSSVCYDEFNTNDELNKVHQKKDFDEFKLSLENNRYLDEETDTLTLKYSYDSDELDFNNKSDEIPDNSSNNVENLQDNCNIYNKFGSYCPIKTCRYDTTDKMDLFTHILQIHGLFNRIDRVYQCSICEMKYTKHDIVIRHLKNRHGILSTVAIAEAETGLYKCPKCDCSYKQKQCMNIHLKKEHRQYFDELLIEQQREYEIQDKKYNFDQEFRIVVNKKSIDFENHEASSDLTKDKFKLSEKDGLWHCGYCEIAKKTKSNLLNHIRGTHMNNTVCDVCGKQYSTSAILHEHKKSHSESKYKCNLCDKIFKTIRIYRQHVMRIHTGIKKFKCNYCDKMFFDTSSRKSHEKIVHLKDKSFQCDVCGESFYTSTRLRYHIRRHTGEKPYHCDLCEKQFYSNEMLMRHRPLHFDEKPYECDICLVKFKTKRYLRWHKEQHSKTEKYECTECGLRFKKYTLFYNHKKSMHCVKQITQNPLN